MVDSVQLAHYEAQLVSNLETQITINEDELLNRWHRGQIWANIRPLFGLDIRAFGKWRKEFIIGRATNNPLDSAAESKLLLCAGRMTRDQFMKLGWTNARTVVHDPYDWYHWPDEIANLIETFSGSTRQFEIAFKAIKANPPSPENVAVVERIKAQEAADIAALKVQKAEAKAAEKAAKAASRPPRVTKSKAPTVKSLTAELELARDEIAILRGQYAGVGDEFFHPDERLRALQMEQLRQDAPYARLLFGLEYEFDRRALSRGRSRLQLKYHTDRGGGDNELSILINQINEDLEAQLALRERLEQQAERNANFSSVRSRMRPETE